MLRRPSGPVFPSTLGRILLDPDGAEGGTAAPPAPTPTPETPAKPAEAPAPAPVQIVTDPSEGFRKALERHQNDATRLAEKLYTENYEYRREIRDMKARVPAEGAVVLATDDAAAFSEYRTLGTVAELKAALSERDTSKAELGTLRKAETVRDAAALHGFKPTVLADLVGKEELTFVEAKGKDGKPVREAHIRGGGDSTTKLTDWLDLNKRDYLPVLRADAAATERPRGTPPRAPGAPPPRDATAPTAMRRNVL